MTASRAKNHSVEEWAQIIRGEYDESPGLSLTRGQVRRLWALDPEMCDAVLKRLTTIGFLRKNSRNMFVKVDGCL